MLLVIDVGNTHITLGVFKEKELVGTFRLTTRQNRTSDEYGIFMCDLLKYQGIPKEEIEDVIISSVVPDVMHSLTSSVIKYFHVKPLNVGPGCKTGIRITAVNPKEVGADRIVDAVAAYEIYGGPVLVLDFGTATTYDLITEDGSFAAGITSPGIEISAKALWQDGSQAAENRYSEAGEYTGKGNYQQYAGWSGLWLYWTGGIYCEKSKRRVWYRRFEGCGNRRSWKAYC